MFNSRMIIDLLQSGGIRSIQAKCFDHEPIDIILWDPVFWVGGTNRANATTHNSVKY